MVTKPKPRRCFEPCAGTCWDAAQGRSTNGAEYIREIVNYAQPPPVASHAAAGGGWDVAVPKRIANARRRRVGHREAVSAVRARDEDCCVLCDQPAWHVHHIVPIAHGGDNDLDNLVCVCGPCHGELHANPNSAIALPGCKARFSLS